MKMKRITLYARVGRFTTLLLLFVTLLSFSTAKAQQAVRFNEIVLDNESGFMDTYGQRSAWVELYNTSAATVNIGGLFLTDNPEERTKYPIRQGSKKTLIPPRQTFVLHLDGNNHLGVHHIGLTIDSTKENTLYLYDSDGVTLIDQITIPILTKDQAYARIPDGTGSFQILNTSSADEANSYVHGKENINNFKTHDPFGLVMTIIAMGTVFVALLILFLMFRGIAAFFKRKDNKKVVPQNEESTKMTSPKKKSKGEALSSDDVSVAIAMALHDYLNDGTQAAIAMALYQAIHTTPERTGMIYIEREKQSLNWGNKSLMMRSLPTRSQK